MPGRAKCFGIMLNHERDSDNYLVRNLTIDQSSSSRIEIESFGTEKRLTDNITSCLKKEYDALPDSGDTDYETVSDPGTVVKGKIYKINKK